jgi:hypothetical protein
MEPNTEYLLYRNEKPLLTSSFYSSSAIEYYYKLVEKYHNEIGQMTKQKERDLLYNYKVFGDLRSREILIIYNIKMVISIIKNYSSMIKNSELYNELLQEGIYGLIKALEMYDITRVDANKFSTYANIKIKHYVSEYVESKMNLIKLPSKKFRSIGKILNKIRDDESNVTYEDMLVINATAIKNINRVTKGVVREEDDDGSVVDSYLVYDKNVIDNQEINYEDIDTLRIKKKMLETKLVYYLLVSGIGIDHIKNLIDNKIIITELSVKDFVDILNSLGYEGEIKFRKIEYCKIQYISDKIKKSNYCEIIKWLIQQIQTIMK